MVKCNKASFHFLLPHSNQQNESKRFLALGHLSLRPLPYDICIWSKPYQIADAFVMCLVLLSIYHLLNDTTGLTATTLALT